MNKNSVKKEEKTPVFIMIVGFSQSGKSTLCNKIVKDFGKVFTRIDANKIHDFLNETYPIYQDDNTVTGEGFEIRQSTTSSVREAMIGVLLSNGYSVLLDSCNLSEEKRKSRLSKAKEANSSTITMIIYNKITEKELYKNLREVDKRNVENNEKPAWVDLYEKVQKPSFVKPKPSEADYYVEYSGDNYEEVKRRLDEVLERKGN